MLTDIMDALNVQQEPRHLRIFIVENHADTRLWLTRYLEQMGHTVSSAVNMRQALASLPSSDCQVLLSDIGLPDGDGWILLEQLHLPHPPYAIAMSGFGLNADSQRSKAAGYRHHLLKPFDPDELDAMLEQAGREMVS